MSLARRLHHTYEDYLRASANSATKLEFYDGEIYAMAGGTPAHAALAAQATIAIGPRLPTNCRTYSSDLRVQVESTGLATYPDLTVVCGEPRRASNDAHAVTNPTVLVEVTSRSTEDYDRGEKLSQYQQIPSLQVILLVSHRAPRITVVTRTSVGWAHREARAGEQLELPALGVSLPVDEVYGSLKLDSAD